jgi:hypothetical protein
VINFPITFATSDAGGFSEGHVVTIESNLIIAGDNTLLRIGDADRPAIDCVVSAWTYSACTKTCGTGSKEKTRTVTKKTHYGGVACPTLVNTLACNRFACPVDCKISVWSGLSACTKTCGTGTQFSSRSVLTLEAHGGSTCPYTRRYQTCNTQLCNSGLHESAATILNIGEGYPGRSALMKDADTDVEGNMYIINSVGKVVKVGGDMSVKQTVDFSHLGLDTLMSIKVYKRSGILACK